MPGGFQEDRPIFLQIAEMLEDAILTGAFPEGEQVPSTTEISVRYQINPAEKAPGAILPRPCAAAGSRGSPAGN